MKIRDNLWLAITVILSVSFSMLSYDSEGLLDINIHDTYFVISNEYFWVWITITIFSLSYLLKCLLNGFSSKPSNLILLISLGLGTLIMIPVSQFVYMVSGCDDTLKDTSTANFWKNIYYGFVAFYILFFAVFGFSTFKTGQNWKQ